MPGTQAKNPSNRPTVRVTIHIVERTENTSPRRKNEKVPTENTMIIGEYM